MPRRLVLILIALGLTMTVTAAPVEAGLTVSLTKTDTPDPVLAGGELTYTIGFEHTVTGVVFGIEVIDPVPAGTSIVSATSSVGTVIIGAGTVTWNFDAPSDETEELTIIVEVDPGTPAGTVLTNTATMSFIGGQAQASATTTVAVPPPPTPTPTPAASLVNAATAPPATGSPILALGFAALLIGSLGTLAFANARRR